MSTTFGSSKYWEKHQEVQQKVHQMSSSAHDFGSKGGPREADSKPRVEEQSADALYRMMIRTMERVLEVTWKIRTRRAGKLYKAPSRLCRSQIFQIHALRESSILQISLQINALMLALDIFNFRFRKSLIFDLIFKLHSQSKPAGRPTGSPGAAAPPR